MRKMLVEMGALEAPLRDRIAKACARHGFEVYFTETDAQAQPLLGDVEIILGASAALAENAPRLRWLCTPTAGVNQFAAPGCFAAKDAVLSNSRGAFGATLAEHVLMVTLAMLRRLPEYGALTRARQWRHNLPQRSILGSRIVLLGTGDIGCETARRLRPFAPASIVGVNRSGAHPQGLFDAVVTTQGMDALLPETDVLILSLPGTRETEHLFNAERLTLLPDGALIVNVGRGSAIDTRALEAELRAGRLRAALDVFEMEPLPEDSSLWDCPNLLITPHAAGNHTLGHTRARIVELFLEDFENYCADRPLARQIDLKRGY